MCSCSPFFLQLSDKKTKQNKNGGSILEITSVHLGGWGRGFIGFKNRSSRVLQVCVSANYCRTRRGYTWQRGSEVSSERSLHRALGLINTTFIPDPAHSPLLSLCIGSCICLHGI